MKVPYHLRWLPTSAPATALLVPGHRVHDLLRVCAELGFDPLPAIYVAADGFVVHLPTPTSKPIAGAVRLHGLSPHLLMPANAELAPPLLPDEASALVSKRGLVFLPGGRVLEYDPRQPIALASLVHIADVRHRPWSALPEARTLADELTEISLLDFGPSPEQILEPGGAGIGTEAPTLEGGSLPTRALANVLFKLGQGLANLGQSLGAKSLSVLGAKLLGGAMSLVPALSEKLMGEQEAKLRELLRQFREGNIDKALERALPLGGDPARGMVPSQNAELPTHPLYYSLVNLLAGSVGGPVSMWFTPDNTYYELLKEYRKQAELAVSRGDFRRAAFIYAKLLNEYHSAAKVLAQGGLHRDAAILYEKKLLDLSSAAREWEAAGEFDRALLLYRKMGEHALAGDLLRRIGAEERAVKEYQIAAAKLLETGPKHYEAGELLRVRAARPDLALAYYEAGWQNRPDGNPLPCATRLVQHHAAAGKADPFLAVVGAAEVFFVLEHDAESTGNFFTEVARLAATPPLQAIAEEVYDRALMGIARKMTQTMGTSSRNPAALAGMLKNPAVWPVPVVCDAQYALTELGHRPRAVSRPAYPRVRVGTSIVTAVCQTPIDRQVFLGFESGEVVCYEPTSGAIHTLTRETGPIVSLLADASKTYLLILSEMPGRVCLRVVSLEVGYRLIDSHWLDVSAPAWLATPAINGKAEFAVVWFAYEYRVFTLPNLILVHSGPISGWVSYPDTRGLDPDTLLYGSIDGKHESLWMLAFAADSVQRIPDNQEHSSPMLNWTPAKSEANSLRQIPVRAEYVEEMQFIEITGLSRDGQLRQATLALDDEGVRSIFFSPVGPDPYLAFACVRADLLAGVHIKGIDWCSPARKTPTQTLLTLTNPVAAFPLPELRELLIVEADGLLTRVPITE